MFNASNIQERHAAGELNRTSTKSRPSKNSNHPKDTRSEHLLYRNGNGDEVATAHYYVCPGHDVSPIDPKTLTIGNLRYIVHPDRFVRNPEDRLPYVWMRKCYGWARRKIICPFFGPRAILPPQIVQFSMVPLRSGAAHA